jgi:hypothetical protein
LATFVRIEVLLFLVGVLLAIGYRAMIGELHIGGLLADSGTDGELSTGRVQLLVFMLAQAGTYVGEVLADPHRFPKVPMALVLAFAGSNAIYLGGKSRPLFQRPPGGE